MTDIEIHVQYPGKVCGMGKKTRTSNLILVLCVGIICFQNRFYASWHGVGKVFATNEVNVGHPDVFDGYKKTRNLRSVLFF